MIVRVIYPLLLVFLVSGNLYSQAERILNYETQIEVFTDRSVEVTESIQVYAAGDVIKRGITRSLPTSRYLNQRKVDVDYQIMEVTKNGSPETYHTESGGDLMLYLGERDVYLSPGIYDYVIKYRVKGQVGFYEDFDEIYWNAIGNDARFAIERASCRIVLPDGAVPVQESAYVGFRGEQKKDYTMSIDDGDYVYRVDRPLRPGEGLTVAVGFEKGLVRPPGFFQRYGSFIVAVLGLLFLFPYYIYTWMKHGQDPPTPPSYPIWSPPDGLSAASINYIHKGHYQTKGFTASVIDLAIKGYLQIVEEEDSGFFKSKKYFRLVRLKAAGDDLPREEKELMKYLFIDGDQVDIKGKYDADVEHTYDMHKSSLSGQHRAFLNKGLNLRFIWLPILVTIGVFVIAVIISAASNYGSGLNLTGIVAFAVTSLVGLSLYIYLIRRPSEAKLDLRSRIKGFKMYLEMAEKDRLALLNPPEMTPKHFEEALPFAFALGVEHKWSKKFKEILEKAQYKPEWHNAPNTVYFSNHFGKDFSKTMGSAVTQPSKTGSGGGSGGGGFSGGGGGGGGVGGW